MPDASEWWIFFGAAVLIAVAPGPGILYVLARSLHGGKAAGIRSSLGNALGASLHVLAATVGLSALLASSAIAFTIVKLVGAAYLIYLGIQALWELRTAPAQPELDGRSQLRRSAVLQGFISEALNPKTAMFFLAFIPQFVHPERGSQTMAFLVLGLVFVALTLTVDLLVAAFAGTLSNKIAANPRWRRRQQAASGATLIGLGGALAVAQH